MSRDEEARAQIVSIEELAELLRGLLRLCIDGVTSATHRHTCVALLIDLGLQQYDVMRHLGHSSIKTTLDLYGHEFPNRDGDLRRGLNDIYRLSLKGLRRDAQGPVEIKDWPNAG